MAAPVHAGPPMLAAWPCAVRVREAVLYLRRMYDTGVVYSCVRHRPECTAGARSMHRSPGVR